MAQPNAAKVCSMCYQSKPLSEFHVKTRARDGLTPACADCLNAAVRARRADPERREQIRVEGRQRQAQWRANLTEQSRERIRERDRCAARDYYARNRAKVRAYQDQYQAENQDKLQQIQQDWYARNAEHKKKLAREYRAQNAAAMREKRATRRRDNPELFRQKDCIAGSLRRARKLAAASAPFTVDQLRLRLEYWDNKCWVCGDIATAVDHVKPLAAGGAHMLCNLRPICKLCNSAKNCKWPLPTRAEIFGAID